MTSPAERAALVEEARSVIEAGSKSFRFASRLFDRETRERAWLLYSWCRACDDIVDGQSLGHSASAVSDPQARIRFVQAKTEAALAGEAGLGLPFDALRTVAAECALPRRFIDDHLAGFARDSASWKPETADDLLSYCYQVAGAVGCLMAVIMGVSPEDDETLDRAADLGIAFQLANIMRDLKEDCANGRCYLPVEWLSQAGLTREDHLDPVNRDKLVALGARMGALADAYQASARAGADRLPYRSRWAVLSAAGIYGAIAEKVVHRGARAWDSRAVVPKIEKLRHVAMSALVASLPPVGAKRSGLWTRPR